MRFSERIGAREPPKSGLEDASIGLRTALWNFLHSSALPLDATLRGHASSNARAIWNHLGWRTDQVPVHPYDMRGHVSEHWFRCEWPEFFDVVEFVARLVAPSNPPARRQWYEMINSMLEAQGCAYRLIAEEFAPLTNPAEVAEVARAA